MRTFIISFLLFSCIGLQAQTLFSFGNNTVDKSEFWRAYTKNNNSNTDEKSVREYLDLYIRFKLKVQAAKDAKLDTLTSIKNDIAGFRAQLVDQYMKNMTDNKELIQEAAARSKEELEIAHVFIAFNEDTANARKQIELAYKELQSGTDFGKVAATYSNTDHAKNNKGYIGYVTVFSLPYELENAVYALTPGAFSKPVSSFKGWHIFKLISKRNSLGKMKAAQILISVNENAQQEEKQEARNLADSVYKLLQNGMKFEEAANTFSTDKLTFAAGGMMQEFTFPEYDASFSNKVFALKKDLDITEPFLTSMGWHIVKRVSLTALNPNINDATVWDEWNNKVTGDSRIAVAIEKLKEKLKVISGYKPAIINEKKLWALTDTMLNAKNYVAFFKNNTKHPLFYLKNQMVSFTDWLQYAKSIQSFPKIDNKNDYSTVLKQYVNETIEQYYKDRLENINDDFRYQLKEFTDGSLLFEVMEQNIWSKAPADSVGLKNYFASNQSKYKWQASADAIVFNCADTSVANMSLKMMRQDPEEWKEIMDLMEGRALADSGRFEFTQLPVKQASDIIPGLFTPVEINPNDGSASFCFILNKYPENDPRSFDEARGLVINDYQLLLEEKWITELKKKYPVKVNEEVVKGLGK